MWSATLSAMSIFQTFMTDRVTLVKKDGQRFENLPASVQSGKKIYTENPKIPIEDGDQFERQLPSGIVETFTVLDAGFQQGFSGMPSHYQSTVRKNTASAAPAKNVQSHVQNFFGSVGNVAQGSQGFSQTANIGIQPEELGRLVRELRDHLEDLNLDSDQRRSAQAELTILEGQIADPNPSVVQQAGKSLRNITEGAIGSLLATAVTQPAVWQWIHQMLARF